MQIRDIVKEFGEFVATVRNVAAMDINDRATLRAVDLPRASVHSGLGYGYEYAVSFELWKTMLALRLWTKAYCHSAHSGDRGELLADCDRIENELRKWRDN